MDEELRAIWERVRAILEPQDAGGVAALLGASMTPGLSTAVDAADFAAAVQDRDPIRGGIAALGAGLPFISGSGIKALGKVPGIIGRALKNLPDNAMLGPNTAEFYRNYHRTADRNPLNQLQDAFLNISDDVGSTYYGYGGKMIADPSSADAYALRLMNQLARGGNPERFITSNQISPEIETFIEESLNALKSMPSGQLDEGAEQARRALIQRNTTTPARVTTDSRGVSLEPAAETLRMTDDASGRVTRRLAELAERNRERAERGMFPLPMVDAVTEPKRYAEAYMRNLERHLRARKGGELGPFEIGVIERQRRVYERAGHLPPSS